VPQKQTDDLSPPALKLARACQTWSLVTSSTAEDPCFCKESRARGVKTLRVIGGDKLGPLMKAHMHHIPRIAVIGSANIDVSLDVPNLPEPHETQIATGLRQSVGGKGLNQAVALSRLGCHTRFLAAVGKDGHGDIIRRHLEDIGLQEIHLLTRPDLPTGSAYIFVGAGGENMIVANPGANGSLAPADVEAHEEMIRTSDALVVQLEVPLATVRKALEIARACGVLTLLNPAPIIAGVLDLLPLVDVITPNQNELASLNKIQGQRDTTLAGQLRALIRGGAREAVVTLGRDGCTALVDGTLVRIEAHPVQAIDATGAGDIFTGALTLQLAHGEGMAGALRFANAAAALSVSRKSADTAPTYEDVLAFLAQVNG
jgi:ribokinase